MNKLTCSVAILAAAGTLCAQEAGRAPATAPVQTTTTVTVAAAVTETKSLSTAAAATEDGGAAIIARAEEKAAVVAALPDEPGESALNKVNTDLEAMGIASGYDAADKLTMAESGESIVFTA